MNRRQRRQEMRSVRRAKGREDSLHLGPSIIDLFQRGVVDHQAGRLLQAEAAYRQILTIDPAHAEAHSNLGGVLNALGRLAEAEASFREALRLRPNAPEVHSNLGVALMALGRRAEAEASFREALRLRPNYPEAHNNLGVVLNALGRLTEAEASFREALRLQPNFPDAHNNLGNALIALIRWRESIACFERLLSLKPDDPATKLALCIAELPILYADEAEITERRASYAARLKSLAARVADMSHVAAFADGIGQRQPFYLPYQGQDDRELQSIYGTLACRAMVARFGATKLPPPPSTDEPVKVGIVSGFFCQHTVWKLFIRGWLTQMDRRRFVVYSYHTDVRRDGETALAEALSQRFVQGPFPLDRWREVILADAPNVLIYPEIGMDNVSAQLAAQRLARVQCNSWGHPVTSGFPTVDYFLSSELMEPPGAEAHYTEGLVRLPNLSIYYEPANLNAVRMTRAEMGLRPDATVFWCGQSLFKYLPQFDYVFARIASSVGNCQFVFIAHHTKEVTDFFRNRLASAFEGDAAYHCVFLDQLDMHRFAAAIGQCDVVLDSIGWSGGVSTMETLVNDLRPAPMTTSLTPLAGLSAPSLASACSILSSGTTIAPGVVAHRQATNCFGSSGADVLMPGGFDWLPQRRHPAR